MQNIDAQHVASLHLASTLVTIETILALHDAGVIDKAVVVERWRKLAARQDLTEMTDVVRQLIKMAANGLEVSGDPK